MYPYFSHLFRVRHPYTDEVVEEYPMAGEEAVHMEALEEEGDAVSGKICYSGGISIDPYIS